MRRTPIVLSATAAGLVGVLSYQTHTKSFAGLASKGVQAALPASSADSRSGSAAAATNSGPGSSGAGSSGSSGAGASGSSGAGSSGSSGAGASRSAQAGSAPTPLVARQGTGPLVTYGYGELAVKVTVSGGKITSVGVSGLRTADQYSQQLAQQVIPMLRSEVIQAQSGQINGVTGATYTSEAFAQSLQRELKKLGV